jgi:hypothetical protein
MFLRSLLTRSVGPLAALAVALAFTPARAGANTYTYSATEDPTTASCVSGDCFIVTQFFGPSGGPTLNAGDTVTLDVTFTSPFTVAGATEQSAIFGAVLDTNYFNCAQGLPSCGPLTSDSATSTETLPGYMGPAINNGPNTFSAPGFYTAYSFVDGPNSGFSATGFDATFNINNSDPSSIYAIAVESQVTNAPEPGTLGLVLLGVALMFAMRRRLRLGIGPAA